MKAFILLLNSLLAVLPITTNANNDSDIIISVIGRGGNNKDALKNAYQQINKKFIDNYLSQGNSNYSKIQFQIDNNQAFNLPKILISKKLGRSKDGVYARIRVTMTKENYLEILKILTIKLQNKMHIHRAWEESRLEKIKQTISTLKILLNIEIKSLYQEQVEFSNKLKFIEKELDRIIKLATLNFIGETKGIELYINGKKSKTHEIELIPGKHLFEIHKKNHLTLSGTVYVNPGEKRTILVHLVKEPKKQINVDLNISENLKKHKNYIKKILQTLGFSTNLSTPKTFDINLELYEIKNTTVNNELIIDSYNYSIVASILEKKSKTTLLSETWQQSFSVAQGFNYNKSYDKDLIRRGLYHFYQRINRDYILSGK